MRTVIDATDISEEKMKGLGQSLGQLGLRPGEQAEVDGRQTVAVHSDTDSPNLRVEIKNAVDNAGGSIIGVDNEPETKQEDLPESRQ